ncbi:hypothetical protein EON65_38910 [archaeon]|nr:MAG: hypothetical protein EON65_38910 [archaeon]
MSTEWVAQVSAQWRELLVQDGVSLVLLESVYVNLLSLNDIDLLHFFACDVSAQVKSALTHETPSLRYAHTKYIGQLLIKLWVNLHETDIEGCYQFESHQDAVRKKEDLLDYITEHFKAFSNQVINRPNPATPDAPGLNSLQDRNAVALVLSSLLQAYHQQDFLLELWVESLTGVVQSATELYRNRVFERQRARSVCLGPLVQGVISIVCEDIYILIKQCTQFISYQNHSISLLNHFFLCMLKALPHSAPESVECKLPSQDSRNIFAIHTADPTHLSRTNVHPIAITPTIAAHVHLVLLPILNGAMSLGERALVARDLVLLLQHEVMRTTRQQVRVWVWWYDLYRLVCVLVCRFLFVLFLLV